MRQGSRQPLSPTASRILPFDALNWLLQNESYPHLVRLLRPFHGSECAAMIASLTEREQRLLLENLPDRDLSTTIMTYLDPGTRSDLLPQLSTGFMVEMVQRLPRDDAVDILAEIPAARLAEIREHLPADIAAEIDSLLTHDAESAGGLMTTQYLAMKSHTTVAGAIGAIRQAEQAETVYDIYVVDAAHRLVGVLSLRQLVLADPETPLQQRVEFHRLRAGRYELIPLEDNRLFRSAALEGFWLDIRWLLAEPLPSEYDTLQEILRNG